MQQTSYDVQMWIRRVEGCLMSIIHRVEDSPLAEDRMMKEMCSTGRQLLGLQEHDPSVLEPRKSVE